MFSRGGRQPPPFIYADGRPSDDAIARAALWIAKYQPQFMDEVIFIFVGSVLAIAVTIAVGMLAIFQWSGVVKNQTQIESWIVEKVRRSNSRRNTHPLPGALASQRGVVPHANHETMQSTPLHSLTPPPRTHPLPGPRQADSRDRESPFIFPYDLKSAMANVKETLNQSLRGDGVEWAVVEGSDQYSLTEEQLAQKKAKRDATETFAIGKATDRVRGCSFGVRTWWRGPWPCDARVSVAAGDYVSVWAGNKSWYYGEKVTLVDGKTKTVKPRQRGWFPIDCTVQNHKKE